MGIDEIYILVSEIHKTIDLALGIKNVFELEGVINPRDCCFKFLNRSIPIFPKELYNFETQWTEINKSKSPIYR